MSRTVSTALSPAAGSSSSSTDGAGASAMASPSSRCSPHESIRASSPSLWPSPTKARISRARSIWPRSSKRFARLMHSTPANLVRDSRWQAVSTLSSAEDSGKMLVRWNMRTSPRSAIR